MNPQPGIHRLIVDPPRPRDEGIRPLAKYWYGGTTQVCVPPGPKGTLSRLCKFYKYDRWKCDGTREEHRVCRITYDRSSVGTYFRTQTCVVTLYSRTSVRPVCTSTVAPAAPSSEIHPHPVPRSPSCSPTGILVACMPCTVAARSSNA